MTEQPRNLHEIAEEADRERAYDILDAPGLVRLAGVARALVGGEPRPVAIDVFGNALTFDIEGPHGCISITVNPS